MLDKQLEDLTVADFLTLVSNRVQESRSLEFKRDAVGRSDDQKREFLGDISALANTIGGDLVFGVEEDQGVAVAAEGVLLDDPDAEILRLENILRGGIEPRIPSLRCHWVLGSSGRGYIVIRVQKSWAAPHRVIANYKFFGRSDRSKYPLDVAELRAAFLLAESTTERMRSFVTTRASLLEAGDAPVPLRGGPRLLFHLIPLSSFISPPTLRVDDRTALLRPIGGPAGVNFFHTLEGFLTYSGSVAIGADGCYGYALTFRNGIIESASSLGVTAEGQIHGESIESDIWPMTRRGLECLGLLGVQPPFFIAVTLTGVRGCSLAPSGPTWGYHSYRMNRDTLFLPPLEFETVPTDFRLALRPLFDLLWNSFGFPGSPR